MIARVYYLVHKETKQPFYVGCTLKALHVRFSVHQHKKDASSIELLEEVPEEEGNIAESFWIGQLKAWGFVLINQVDPMPKDHAQCPPFMYMVKANKEKIEAFYDEYISQYWIIEMLGIKYKVFLKLIKNGQVPQSMYTTGVAGIRFFKKSKLLQSV